MTVDMVRTCYKNSVRTVQGGLAVAGRYVRVTENTPGYRGPNLFMAQRAWEQGYENAGMGEQSDPCCQTANLEWFDGAGKPKLAANPRPCGTIYAREHGARIGTDPLVLVKEDGQADCCGPLAIWRSCPNIGDSIMIHLAPDGLDSTAEVDSPETAFQFFFPGVGTWFWRCYDCTFKRPSLVGGIFGDHVKTLVEDIPGRQIWTYAKEGFPTRTMTISWTPSDGTFLPFPGRC